MPSSTDSSFITDFPLVTGTDVSNNFTASLESLVNATTSGQVAPKRLLDFAIFRTGLWLFRNGWKIVSPPGLLGNLLIIIVTSRMKPFNSTSLFMTSLAVVDLLATSFRIPFNLLRFTTTTICQLMWYLYNALPLFSNWILVLWTIERLIAVQFPLRVMEWCTVKRTAFSIIAAGIFSFAVDIPWSYTQIISPKGDRCVIRDESREFIYKLWYKVDSSIHIFIPMIIIFLCNILIIYRLQQTTKRHKEMTSNEESRRKREKEQRNTTITLLTVSFAFLILHTPITVYNCMAMSTIVINDREVRATWEFINFVGLTVAEFQNSVNFYLYFLTGRRYRKAFYSLIVPCRKTPTSKSKGFESVTKLTGASTVTNGT